MFTVRRRTRSLSPSLWYRENVLEMSDKWANRPTWPGILSKQPQVRSHKKKISGSVSKKKKYPDVKLHPGKFEGGPGKFCSRWTKFFLKMAKKLKLFPSPKGKTGKIYPGPSSNFPGCNFTSGYFFFFDAGFHFPGDDLEAADCSSIFPSLISYIVLWIDLFWCGQTGQRCGPSYRTYHISTQSSIFLISTFVFTHQYFLSHYRLFVFRCT